PTAIPVPPGVGAFDTLWFHSCAVQGTDLWCWGRNIEGQLGVGDNDVHEEPLLVGQGYVDVCVGSFHSCALGADGSAACTGGNSSGALGTGDTIGANTWQPVLL